MLSFWRQFGRARHSGLHRLFFLLGWPSLIFVLGCLVSHFVMQKSAELTRNTNILCTCGLIASIFAHAFFYLTVVVMVMSAAERCLYMSRRSLLTMRRAVIPYIIVVLVVAVFVTGRGYSWRYSSHTSGTALRVILIVAAVVCFGVMAFLISKFFESFVTIKLQCKQIKTPLTF